MLAKKIQYDYYDYQDYKYEEATLPQVKAKPKAVCNTALRKKAFAIVIMTLFFAFYMVMRNDVFIQNGYTLVQMKEQEAELVKNIEYSKVNLAKAKSPERITVLAAQLGMVPADKNVYVSAVQQTTEQNIADDTSSDVLSVAWYKKEVKKLL